MPQARMGRHFCSIPRGRAIVSIGYRITLAATRGRCAFWRWIRAKGFIWSPENKPPRTKVLPWEKVLNLKDWNGKMTGSKV